RGEIAEAIDREDRGVLEGRWEEGAGDVRLVVLDVVELGPDVGAECGLELGLDVPHPGGVLEPGLEVARAGTAGERPQDLGAEIGLRVAPDRDVVEIAGRKPRIRQAPGGRAGRKAGTVLDPGEAL